MKRLYLWPFILGACCATVTTPDTLKIRGHAQYAELSSEEKGLVEEVMGKALKSNRKDYYFKKLFLLLETLTVSSSATKVIQRKEIDRAIKQSKRERRAAVGSSSRSIEDYMNQEEFYESIKGDKHWVGFQPDDNGPYFYVTDDPLDILVHIKVRLNGDSEDIERILLLEDAIEKHLYIEGFSVNLVFVGHSNPNNDIFDVKVDSGKWPTSHNWSGEHRGLAHELMHLMGLHDEYDKIESHADNKHLPIQQRLTLFLEQMDAELPADAKYGIMSNHFRKPLDRHACEAVGLGEECVKIRMKTFHPDRGK